MSNKEMTFDEAIEIIYNRIDSKLSKLITEQKEVYKVLLDLKSENDFITVSSLKDVLPRNEAIIFLSSMRMKWLRLYALDSEEHKRDILPDGEISNITKIKGESLKVKQGWTKETTCLQKQIDNLYYSLSNNDKKLFFNTFYEITKKQETSHRFTRMFFGTSVRRTKR